MPPERLQPGIKTSQNKCCSVLFGNGGKPRVREADAPRRSPLTKGPRFMGSLRSDYSSLVTTIRLAGTPPLTKGPHLMGCKWQILSSKGVKPSGFDWGRCGGGDRNRSSPIPSPAESAEGSGKARGFEAGGLPDLASLY